MRGGFTASRSGATTRYPARPIAGARVKGVVVDAGRRQRRVEPRGAEPRPAGAMAARVLAEAVAVARRAAQLLMGPLGWRRSSRSWGQPVNPPRPSRPRGPAALG